jgi:hypothetical protein
VTRHGPDRQESEVWHTSRVLGRATARRLLLLPAETQEVVLSGCGLEEHDGVVVAEFLINNPLVRCPAHPRPRPCPRTCTLSHTRTRAHAHNREAHARTGEQRARKHASAMGALRALSCLAH